MTKDLLSMNWQQILRRFPRDDAEVLALREIPHGVR